MDCKRLPATVAVIGTQGALSTIPVRGARRKPGVWLTLGLVALGACTTSGSRPLDLEPQAAPTTEAPAWRHQALSWEKLDAIEQWLQREGIHAQPNLRIEAELQLAEGWLTFLRADQEAGRVPSESLRVRSLKAQQVFDEILASSDATPGQRARAQIGQQSGQVIDQAPQPTGLAILTRSQWGARTPNPSRMTPLRGTWSRITIHHSAETSSTAEGGSLDQSIQTLRGIQRFHMDDPLHEYGDIGYHFLIDSSGRIFEGRGLMWQGAHAGGQDGIHNNQNIGVCVLGDFVARPPSAAAQKSLELLVVDLRGRYRIPVSRIFTHSDLRDTQCPGPALEAWVEGLRGGQP
jgi:hypothetical protein